MNYPTLFDGPDIRPADVSRLAKQLHLVRGLMSDGMWRSLYEISAAVGAPEQSVSARLRDLRKVRFGSLTVERRRRSGGVFEYRVGTKEEA